MNINIINPTINLITNKSKQENSCMTLHIFDIESTPYAEIQIEALRMFSYEDLLNVQIDLGAGFINLTNETLDSNPPTGFHNTTFEPVTLNNTGRATVRVVQGNQYLLNQQDPLPPLTITDTDGTACGLVRITVNDLTNAESKTDSFTRCNAGRICFVFPEPVANDDSYNVRRGTTALFNIMSNDSSGSNLTTISPVIVTQPQNGTIRITSTGKIEYIHGGGTDKSDSFTYKVINSDDVESNIATVSITITDGVVPDNNTKVNIWIDGSGSLTYIRDRLSNIKETSLRQRLEPYYDSPEDYNQKVQVLNTTGNNREAERFLEFISKDLSETGDTIAMIFQDEAGTESALFNIERGYHDNNCHFSATSGRLDQYDEDIDRFHSRLDNYQHDYYLALFPVTGCEAFDKLTKAMVEGEGNYSGRKGVSELSNVTRNLLYPFEEEDYYSQAIENAILELGFDI